MCSYAQHAHNERADNKLYHQYQMKAPYITVNRLTQHAALLYTGCRCNWQRQEDESKRNSMREGATPGEGLFSCKLRNKTKGLAPGCYWNNIQSQDSLLPFSSFSSRLHSRFRKKKNSSRTAYFSPLFSLLNMHHLHVIHPAHS